MLSSLNILWIVSQAEDQYKSNIQIKAWSVHYPPQKSPLVWKPLQTWVSLHKWVISLKSMGLLTYTKLSICMDSLQDCGLDLQQFPWSSLATQKLGCGWSVKCCTHSIRRVSSSHRWMGWFCMCILRPDLNLAPSRSDSGSNGSQQWPC